MHGILQYATLGQLGYMHGTLQYTTYNKQRLIIFQREMIIFSFGLYQRMATLKSCLYILWNKQTNKPSFLKILITINKQTKSTELPAFWYNVDQEVSTNVSERNMTSIFKVKSLQPWRWGSIFLSNVGITQQKGMSTLKMEAKYSSQVLVPKLQYLFQLILQQSTYHLSPYNLT